MLSILIVAASLIDDPAADLKRMEGSWIATSWSFEGRETLKEGGVRRLIIKDDIFTWELENGDLHSRFATKATNFDPTGDPKMIDLTRERDQQTILGIYKLEGDTLTICTSSRGGRPTDFAAEAGSGNLLRVLKRGTSE